MTQAINELERVAFISGDEKALAVLAVCEEENYSDAPTRDEIDQKDREIDDLTNDVRIAEDETESAQFLVELAIEVFERGPVSEEAAKALAATLRKRADDFPLTLSEQRATRDEIEKLSPAKATLEPT